MTQKVGGFLKEAGRLGSWWRSRKTVCCGKKRKDDCSDSKIPGTSLMQVDRREIKNFCGR